MNMKAGIVGGIGPQSTVGYYLSIIEAYRAVAGDGHYPPLVIDSIDMTEMLALVDSGEQDKLTELLLASLSRLKGAGAEVAVIASNTPHVVFEKIKECSPVKVLSIVEACREEAKAKSYHRLALLGTAFTMNSGFYQACFEQSGIEIVTPREEEQAYIHRKIFEELEDGIVKEQTRVEFLRIIERMREEDGIEAVILGCTELPLILRDIDVPVLNTVEIHVRALVDYMCGR